MIAPNKAISLSESAIGLAPFILMHGPDSQDLLDLYSKVYKKFESIDQFVFTLDVLFVLNRISLDVNTGRVSYVK